jgi:hypothetical protein
MLRFTIREVLWLTVVVGLSTVLIVEHWPEGGNRFSQQELDLYGEALRHAIASHHSDGLIFVDLAGQDPPPEFAGQAIIPLSHAEIADGPPTETAEHFPTDRFRDRMDGSPGVAYVFEIEKWIATDRVEVRCTVLVNQEYGWIEWVILRLKNGRWHYESTSNEGSV